jgi:hypothetical protein
MTRRDVADLAEFVRGTTAIGVFFEDAAAIDVSQVEAIRRSGNLHCEPLCCTGLDAAEWHLLIW